MMKRVSRLSLVVGALVGFLAVTAPSVHAAQDSAATASAKAHFKSGTTFYDLGKFDEAIREFEAAYEAKSDPAFLFNLAQANRLAGHSAEALHFYRTYLRYVPNPPNLSDIQTNIRNLEKVASDRPGTAPAGSPPMESSGASPAPRVEISVAPPPPPAPLSTAPSGAPPVLSPRASGETGATDGQGGGPSVSPGPQEPPAQAGLSSRKKVGKVLTVVGAAVFGSGLIFGLMAGADSRKVETSAVFDPTVEKSGKALDTLKWVALVTGAISAAAGVVLYATSPAPTVETPPRTALLPFAGPHLGGAILQVSFR